ncbi:MAG: TolC family protein [Pseudohongiella sp.]|uniref:TolC family protein n=1 Tax=Pseudohongiella sp. TaxID=1979412 RepID=UPI0034A02757
MPNHTLAVSFLLPVLVACSATSHDPHNEQNHEQVLFSALYSWSPALQETHAQTVDTQSTSDHSMGPSSADITSSVLSPTQAQSLALQQSPAIRAMLASQGIADAAYRQATLINNPGLSASALRPEDGGRWQTEFAINLGVLDWLTQGLRKQQASAEFRAAQSRVLDALSAELSSVSSTYFAAVAARQLDTQYQQAAETARLNAELARQLNEAGNLSELDWLRYDSEFARRQQAAQQSRFHADEALAALKLKLGMGFNSELVIPQVLPDTENEMLDINRLKTLSQNEDEFRQLLASAWEKRPDARLLRDSATMLQKRLGLQAQRFGMTEAGVGLVTERDSDGSNASGFEFDLSIPVFDQGQTTDAYVQAQLEQLAADKQTLELVIENQLGTSITRLLSLTSQIMQLRDEDIPRHQQMLDLALQEYNFMLTGAFDLLSVKQDQNENMIRYIGLLQQYWVEYARLMQFSANQEHHHD